MQTEKKALAGIIFMTFSFVCHGQIICMSLKADKHKEIVPSETTIDLYAESLITCAAQCSIRSVNCCALSYLNKTCRLDSSCQFNTQDKLYSKVMYSPTRTDVKTTDETPVVSIQSTADAFVTTDETVTSALTILPTTIDAVITTVKGETSAVSTLPNTDDLRTTDTTLTSVLSTLPTTDETTLAVTTMETLITPPSCDGCIPFGSSNYLFVASQVSYDIAKVDCEARGAKLVEIESAEENAFLKDNLSALFGSRTWIGAYLLVGVEGLVASDYRWNSNPNQPMVYTNWESKEPNGGNCAVISPQGNAYQWASQTCVGPYYYTCEYQ